MKNVIINTQKALKNKQKAISKTATFRRTRHFYLKKSHIVKNSNFFLNYKTLYIDAFKQKGRKQHFVILQESQSKNSAHTYNTRKWRLR